MPFTIYPYLLGKSWVFDHEPSGLKSEAFDMGMSEMISRLIESKDIPNAAHGFTMEFSDEPFDCHDVELEWLRGEEPPISGNWYRGSISGQIMEGWLCPALFCFFTTAPKRLYVGIDQLAPGVDPIWHISPEDPGQRRFMSAEGQ